jgi:hypothetical protein
MSDKIFFGFMIGIMILFEVLTMVIIVLGIIRPIKDFLREIKRSQIDEKIAMLYGYSSSVKTWKNTRIDFMIERILSDIRAVGRIKTAINDDQRERLVVALTELFEEMKREGYTEQVSKIESAAIVFEVQ